MIKLLTCNNQPQKTKMNNIDANNFGNGALGLHQCHSTLVGGDSVARKRPCPTEEVQSNSLHNANGFGGVYAPATSRQRTSINPSVSSLLAQYAAINDGGGEQHPNLLVGAATPQPQQFKLPQAAAASTIVQQQQQHPTQDLSALLVNNDLLIQQLRQAQGAAGATIGQQQQPPQDLSAIFVNNNLLTQQLRQAQGLQDAASAQNNQISFPGVAQAVAQGVATGVQPSLPQFQHGQVQPQPQANLPAAATGLLANLMQQQQQPSATGSANAFGMSSQELRKFALVVHMMCQSVCFIIHTHDVLLIWYNSQLCSTGQHVTTECCQRQQ